MAQYYVKVNCNLLFEENNTNLTHQLLKAEKNIRS